MVLVRTFSTEDLAPARNHGLKATDILYYIPILKLLSHKYYPRRRMYSTLPTKLPFAITR